MLTTRIRGKKSKSSSEGAAEWKRSLFGCSAVFSWSILERDVKFSELLGKTLKNSEKFEKNESLDVKICSLY